MPPSSFDPATDAETVDRVLSALTATRRRLILAYFEDSVEQTATLAALAAYVARHDETDVSTQDRARVLLHHKDIPKLADADLVDYDTRTRTIRYWGAPSGVEDAEWARHLTREQLAEWNK